MIVIALVAGVCYAGVVALGAAFGWKELGSEIRSSWVELVLGGVMIPAIAQALAADVIGTRMRRRLFDSRVRAAWGLARLAAIASAGSLAVSAVAMPLADRIAGEGTTHDALVVGVSAALCGGLCSLFVSRVRAGECVHCGYALASGVSRCAECGRFSGDRDQQPDSNALAKAS